MRLVNRGNSGGPLYRSGKSPKKIGGYEDVSALFAIAFTGLSTDSIGSYAQVGDHASIGYTTDPVSATETVKWSNSNNPADAATYGTGASPTDYSAGDGNPLYLHVTDGGETVTRSLTIRHAPGSVTETGTPFSWTIDDTTLNIDFTSDFTTTNLTGSYVIAGLPTGGVDDTDGTASGTLTGTPSSGNFTVTFTDQYSRTVVGTYAHTTAYRAQATGGADLDLSFVEDSAITPVDLAQNWTTNGNTLTYAINGTAVPPGMSVATDAELSGTPTTVTADATYTLRGTDEYGRTTDDTFTLQITELDDTAPAVASFSIGTQASNGDIPISVGAITEAGSPDDLTLGYVVTGTDQSAATRAQVKTAAEGGTPLTNQLDIGTFAITTAGGTFNEDLTAGIDDATSYVQAVVWDAAGNISTVQADGPVDIDTTAPTLSSPTGTQTGQTTADWGVTSNEAGGTIYAGVRPTASAALTAAQLVAGSGGAGVAWNSDATPTADANNGGSFTGLTAAEAYKVDIVQVDAVGKTSTVTSSIEFTTASAASPPAVTYLTGAATSFTSTTSHTESAVDTLGHNGTDDLFIGIFNIGHGVPDSVSLGGHSASLVSGSNVVWDDYNVMWYRITGQTLGATSDLVVTDSGGMTGLGYAVYSVSDVTTVAVADTQTLTAAAVTSTFAVADGDAALAIVAHKGTGDGGNITWTGATENVNQRIGVRPFAAASVDGLTADASYDIVATFAASSSTSFSALRLS